MRTKMEVAKPLLICASINVLMSGTLYAEPRPADLDGVLDAIRKAQHIPSEVDDQLSQRGGDRIISITTHPEDESLVIVERWVEGAFLISWQTHCEGAAKRVRTGPLYVLDVREHSDVLKMFDSFYEQVNLGYQHYANSSQNNTLGKSIQYAVITGRKKNVTLIEGGTGHEIIEYIEARAREATGSGNFEDSKNPGDLLSESAFASIAESVVLSIGYFDELCEQVYESELSLSPTPDPKEEMGVYVPTNLDECFAELERMLPANLIMAMKIGKQEDMLEYHFGLGMWIRNHWGLWRGSRLQEYFKSMGVTHPDDMSGIILDSFWRHLCGKPINLQSHIEQRKKAAEDIRSKLHDGTDRRD